MKCKVFSGALWVATDLFNAWAEGKALTREVLIHSHIIARDLDKDTDELVIIVIHPEDPYWESTKTQPIRRNAPQTTESAGLERPQVTT